MADYIDRETVLKILEDHPAGTWRGYDVYSDDVRAIMRQVDEQPAADVTPVRRGHWVRVGNGTTCSECMQGLLRINGKQSEWVDLSGMPYCPNCGAKMEAEHDKRESD